MVSKRAGLDWQASGAVGTNLAGFFAEPVAEAALAVALAVGRLGGAVLDVTREEPLPPEHRLWRCPNLVLTQHSGGGAADEIDRKIDFFADNLANYPAGRPLSNRVDFSGGY